MTTPWGKRRTRNPSGPTAPTRGTALPPTSARTPVPAPGPAPAHPVGPRLPPRAGDTRRHLAVGLDCYFCLVTAGLLARPYVDASTTVTEVLGLLAGPALAFSFLNQVVLTAVTGAGLGKLIMGIRVIRLPDAGRPGLWRLVRRWLHGLSLLPLQPWYGLRSFLAGPAPGPDAPHPVALPNGCTGEPYTDPSGLRQVRRRDLAAHRDAMAFPH
ncbi:RDD family protein [Streptomyces sp. NPDC015350]|uniref:RDD family protein n=1 Tax=Streptomyces sp. NPDC015350 TaxID=3364955 RepID=UPI003702C1A7